MTAAFRVTALTSDGVLSWSHSKDLEDDEDDDGDLGQCRGPDRAIGSRVLGTSGMFDDFIQTEMIWDIQRRQFSQCTGVVYNCLGPLELQNAVAMVAGRPGQVKLRPRMLLIYTNIPFLN